jgi:hypothetical protein
MHIGPDDVVIVTDDMSIYFALHFCFSLSPLIAMFRMMGSGKHLDLEREATLPCVLHSPARYSRVVRACVRQYRDLDSEILRREIRGLAISAVIHRSVVAQSLEVRLLLVGISLLLVL